MESNLQDKLFSLAKEKYSPGELLKQLIALLGISRASVYKRLNGEIQLTVGDFEKILHHFELDSARLFQRKSNQVMMSIPPKSDGKDPIIHFLRPIKNQVEALAAIPSSHILFLAVSFPIFYSFLFPELALFKFIVYRNSVWKPSHAKIPPLAISQLARNQEYINLFAAIRNAYSKIDSTEVWTSKFYQSTINEIKFYLECNLFTEPKEALEIMDKLGRCIENIASMAQKGNKSLMDRYPEKEEGGKLQLYYNDSGHFGSTILVEGGNMKHVFLTYDQPNYLFSTDQVLFKDTSNWTGKVVKKSTPITGMSPLDQHKFFNGIRQEIETEKEIIAGMLEK